MTHVFEINDIDAIDPWRGEWERLLARTPHASFFQSWQWLAARWMHVAPECRLRILFVTDDQDGITGILPLIVQPERTRLGTLRVLTWPHDGWSSFYGPLGENPARTLAEGLAYLRGGRRDFNLIDLNSLPLIAVAESPAWEELETEIDMAVGRNLYGYTEHSRVAMIDLVGNWEEYWESRRRDHNRRRNVERCNRRLNEQGHVSYVRHRPLGQAAGDSDPRWDLYDACEQLAARSWQAGLQNGNTLSHEHVRGLLRDAHKLAAEAGALDMNLLYVNERLVAFVYGYHYQGYLDLLRIGFEPELAKIAPGNALWTRMIADSFERRDRIFDLGPTCLDYKQFWMTRVEPSVRLARYAYSPQAQVVRFARWMRSIWQRTADETNRRSKESVQNAQRQVAVNS